MEGTLIFIIYTIWSVYSGYKYIDGRYEQLENNKVLKVLAIIGAGYIIGGFNICRMVVKLGIRITDGFR